MRSSPGRRAEAAAIDQSRLGATHPFIADDLHDLGLAYDALGRGDEARAAFEAALGILERGPGRETPRRLLRFADRKRNEGRR